MWFSNFERFIKIEAFKFFFFLTKLVIFENDLTLLSNLK